MKQEQMEKLASYMAEYISVSQELLEQKQARIGALLQKEASHPVETKKHEMDGDKIRHVLGAFIEGGMVKEAQADELREAWARDPNVMLDHIGTIMDRRNSGVELNKLGEVDTTDSAAVETGRKSDEFFLSTYS